MRKKPTTKNTVPGKTIIQIQRRYKEFCRQTKAKTVQHHQTSFTRDAKGTFTERPQLEIRKLQKEKSH